MLRPIDNYFLQNEEPFKSCLLYMRELILGMIRILQKKCNTGCHSFIIKENGFAICGYIKNTGSLTSALWTETG